MKPETVEHRIIEIREEYYKILTQVTGWDTVKPLLLAARKLPGHRQIKVLYVLSTEERELLPKPDPRVNQLLEKIAAEVARHPRYNLLNGLIAAMVVDVPGFYIAPYLVTDKFDHKTQTPPVRKRSFELSTTDRRFLRALRIAEGEPEEKKS